MFLFKVQDRFLITRCGLMLVPGLGDKIATIGASINIIKPDQTIIETTIRGISFNEFRAILVGKYLTKEDVPVRSEVWLNKN